MKIITKAIEKITPKLRTYANSELKDLKFVARLFTPWSNWTWYIAEADYETGECFGVVHGMDSEVGYFNLKELKEIRGPFGLKIERDMHFNGCDYETAMRVK